MGPPEEDTSSIGTTDAFSPVLEPHLASHARLQPVAEDGDPFMTAPGPLPASRHSEQDATPRRTISRLLKGKEKEWSNIVERKGPLRLLDLPVDILREVINQLPHTNDLTSLALCHSVLHSLTVPCIYSRFDIVWPDSQAQSEPRTGVDALTYGLSTLCMSREVFGEDALQRKRSADEQRLPTSTMKNPYALKRRRRGNNYAQFTRKFSLGNGPLEYVQDYNIAREGGKMLGTLVALAVARMRNLETFVWDMPTGVLRDVWLALSALADREDEQDCRLERVWVRWHDNSSEGLGLPPPPPVLPAVNVLPGGHASLPPHLQAQQSSVLVQGTPYMGAQQNLERVEHPSFSVLPALKSLSVLDIDELPYIDEMSILIARSHHKLRELRVGIGAHADETPWTQVWEGESLQQVDYGSMSTLTNRVGSSRLGGVLGILVGRIYNMRNNAQTAAAASTSPSKNTDEIRPLRPSMTSIDGMVQSSYLNQTENSTLQPETPMTPSSTASFADALSQHSPQSPPSPLGLQGPSSTSKVSGSPTVTPTSKTLPRRTIHSSPKELRLKGPYLDGQLKLEILELERIPISVSVMQRAFDWSVLTSLTLLGCANHDQLWKSLRHLYSPIKPVKAHHSGVPNSGLLYTPSPRRASHASLRPCDYPLKLKKIHTNTASISLINFIKDTLAPNSLETFFIQDSRRMSASAAVSVETIYRGVIKRHRSSLKKLLIDSSDSQPSPAEYGNAGNTRWQRWTLNREVLTFITGGKMPRLRELSFAIEYKDWHFFLQQLPYTPHIRSLHIPHIAEHPHGTNVDPRDLALQIVDIVTLRPDIELCYLGVSNKCFEILENKNLDGRLDYSLQDPGAQGYSAVPSNEPLILEGEEEEEEEDNQDDADDEEDDDAINNEGPDETGTSSESDPDDFVDDDDSEDDDFGSEDGLRKKGPKLRLREILFYDDKVAIFRARHGRL